MHTFKAVMRKYVRNGEKTAWTFVDIPADIIPKLKLKDKKGFRIKGVMDDVRFEKLSTYPTGDGNFIIAVNAGMRKKLGKKEGAPLTVQFELDKSEPLQSKELLQCLGEEPEAEKIFNLLPASHRNYFHRYICDAKTDATKAGRIVHTINAMYKKQNFGEMIRSLKASNK